MFTPPRCVEGGGFTDMEGKLGCDEVYCDPLGGLWLLDDGRRRLRHLTSTRVSQILRGGPLSGDNSASSCGMATRDAAPAGDSPGAATVASLVLDCGGSSETVCTVLFLRPSYAHGAGGARCAVACVVTDKGTVTSYALSEKEETPTVSSSSGFGVTVSCAAAMRFLVADPRHAPAMARHPGGRRDGLHDATVLHLLMGCVVGERSEVVLVTLQSTRQDGFIGSPLEMTARGLFSIATRIECLLWDALNDNVISVSAAGAVDVWSWRTERDVTVHYGSLSWDTTSAGAPVTGCALLTQRRLWVGTKRGWIVCSTFPAVPGRTGAARMCARPAHDTAVCRLLPMALGRAVWSVGGDGRCVRVWGGDGDEVALRGSFTFPAPGLSCLCVAEQVVQSTVWRVQAAGGEAAGLVSCAAYLVTEPIACAVTDEALWCRSMLEERAVQRRLRRGARSERLLWRLTAAMSDGGGVPDDAELSSDQDDSHDSSMADGSGVMSGDEARVRSDEEQARLLSAQLREMVAMVRSAATAQRLLRQCCTTSGDGEAHHTCHSPRASCTCEPGGHTLLYDIENIVRCYRQSQRTIREYRDVLAGLRRVLRPVTSPTDEDGEMDLIAEVRRAIYAPRACHSCASALRGEVGTDQCTTMTTSHPTISSPPQGVEDELSAPSAAHCTTTDDAEGPLPSSSSSSALTLEQDLRRELMRARRALHEEQRQRHESEVALDMAQTELRETSAQLAQSHAMLVAREDQVELLRRSVQAAREAADVSAAEASRLFAMESRLHTADATMKGMQAELSSLRASAEAGQKALSASVSLRQQLARCHASERLLRHLVDDMLRTQNYITTQLNGLADMCRQQSADATADEHRSDATLTGDEGGSKTPALCLAELQNHVLQLRMDVNDQLCQQIRYFHDLHRRSRASAA